MKTILQQIAHAQGRTRCGRRAGLTLVEILIAMGILAFGLFGILTLFPIAIRNISTATGRTFAATVAKSAMASIQIGYLDIWDHKLSSTDSRAARNQADEPDLKDPEIAGYLYSVYNTYQVVPQLSTAIYNYALSAGVVGDGSTAALKTFRIPDDLDDATIAGDQDGNLVIPSWAPEYGWTATFLPMPIGPTIDAHTRYRVQIAVWRKYELKWEGSLGEINKFPSPAAFDGQDSDGDGEIDDSSEACLIEVLPQLCAKAATGDYIRLDDLGIWYRIEDVDDENNFVKLAVPFHHHAAQAAPLSGPASIASRFKLLGVYETIIGPNN